MFLTIGDKVRDEITGTDGVIVGISFKAGDESPEYRISYSLNRSAYRSGRELKLREATDISGRSKRIHREGVATARR